MNSKDSHKDKAIIVPNGLPVGVTSDDWKVFHQIATIAVNDGVTFVGGDAGFTAATAFGLSEKQYLDGIAILESVGWLRPSGVLGSRLPSHMIVSQVGLQAYFSATEPDLENIRRSIAEALLAEKHATSEICADLGVPILLVNFVCEEFESRGWVARIMKTHDGNFVHVSQPVHLERYLAR